MNRRFTLVSKIINKCNFSCDHCSSDSLPSSTGSLDRGYVASVLADFSCMYEDRNHLITGGEPTLYKDLKALAEDSRDLGYHTDVVTNCSWVDLKNPLKSERLFQKFFPEGIRVSASYDLYHLRFDKDLGKKVQLVAAMADGRNDFGVDAAYNGQAEYLKTRKLVEKFPDVGLVSLQNIGRGKDLTNLTLFDDSKIMCMKEANKGFALTTDGVYFCFRGALNGVDDLKIAERYDFDEVFNFIEDFSVKELNRNLREKYVELDDTSFVNHSCDICEEVLKNKNKK